MKRLIGGWLDNHFRNTINEMAFTKRPKKEKSNQANRKKHGKSWLTNYLRKAAAGLV